MAAALCSPGGAAGGWLRSKRRVRWVLSLAAGARSVRVVMCPAVLTAHANWLCPDARACDWLQTFAETAASMRQMLGAPGQAGTRRRSGRVPRL